MVIIVGERMYVTISVPRWVKEALEKGKGALDWGEYLYMLYESYVECRRREAFEKLRALLTEEDLDNIEREYREFRERFRLR